MGLIMSSIVIFIGIILLFVNFKISNRILIFMAIFLLLYKSTEYTIYGLYLQESKIPIEYSTLTYFLFSIYVIFGIKSLKSIATFMGFISGIGYLIVFIFLASQYMSEQGVFLTIMAFINHSICFLGSMILMKREPIYKIEKRKILMFTTIYLIYVIIVSNVVTYTQSFIFILLLLDGGLLEELMPQSSLSAMDYLAYFLIIFILYQFFIQLFIWISHRIYQIKERQEHEYTI